MALIEWNQSLSVGVVQFDQQHHQLVTMLNDLHAAMQRGEGSQVLDTVLGDLIAYTRDHFTAEEILMEYHDYPDFQHHTRAHRLLVEQVHAIQDRVKSGRPLQLTSVMQFLVNWLTNHILTEDKNYRSFFQARGVT